LHTQQGLTASSDRLANAVRGADGARTGGPGKEFRLHFYLSILIEEEEEEEEEKERI